MADVSDREVWDAARKQGPAKKTNTLQEQIDALEVRLEAVEKRAPIPGPKGDKGDPGKSAETK